MIQKNCCFFDAMCTDDTHRGGCTRPLQPRSCGTDPLFSFLPADPLVLPTGHTIVLFSAVLRLIIAALLVYIVVTSWNSLKNSGTFLVSMDKRMFSLRKDLGLILAVSSCACSIMHWLCFVALLQSPAPLNEHPVLMSSLSATAAVSLATTAYLLLDRTRSSTAAEVETRSMRVQTVGPPETTNIFAQRRRYNERIHGNAYGTSTY